MPGAMTWEKAAPAATAAEYERESCSRSTLCTVLVRTAYAASVFKQG